MWIRYVRYQATTQCCYEGNAMLYRGPLVFPERTLVARFRTRPSDDIREWAERIIKDAVEQLAENACKELADDYYACQVDAGIIYTSEVFVGPEVVPPVEVEVKVPEVEEVKVPEEIVPEKEVKVPEVEEVKVEVPEYIKKTIEDLEKRKAEAKTTERKEKIQKTIDELKREYSIK